MLTVQYYKSQIQSLKDFEQIPLRASQPVEPAQLGGFAGVNTANASQNHIIPLEAVATVKYINTSDGGRSLSAAASFRRLYHAEN